MGKNIAPLVLEAEAEMGIYIDGMAGGFVSR